jgi:hypothetical protein
LGCEFRNIDHTVSFKYEVDVKLNSKRRRAASRHMGVRVIGEDSKKCYKM